MSMVHSDIFGVAEDFVDSRMPGYRYSNLIFSIMVVEHMDDKGLPGLVEQTMKPTIL